MDTLCEIDVPGDLSLFLNTGRKHYLGTIDGLRWFHQTAKVYQRQGDIKNINERLWMASKGPSRSSYLLRAKLVQGVGMKWEAEADKRDGVYVRKVECEKNSLSRKLYTRINRTWKAVYAPITSQDIYITNLAYIYYLSDIVQFRKSIIYHDFIPRLTRTITCFIDLQRTAMETAVKRAYHTLLCLPNVIGFKTLFPLVPHISFVFRWTGVARNPQLCDIPICVRYHWHLSQLGGDYLWISPPSSHTPLDKLLPAMETLREIDVPGGLSLFLRTGTNNYWRTTDGLRYFCQIAKVHQQQGVIGDINQRLWMASKGPSRSKWLGCLDTFFNSLEYKRVQQSFPPGRLRPWRSFGTSRGERTHV
ncbi:hypothetical protein EDD85DRAFT_931267 [Armillaria nabsnona]|nr:hypothetical protein EDD85DRAFT_931267 [Armillaria nabsnona]